jgi:long-chain acyl-CoA synthetase
MAKEISQALVVGDRRPYLTALVTLDPEAGLTPEAADQRIQQIVDEVNAGLSRFEQVKRFAILPRDFSMAEGELTPTLKLKRRVCEEHFASEIEALYS